MTKKIFCRIIGTMNGVLALKPLATPVKPELEFVANTGQIWQFLNQIDLAILLGILPKNKKINMKNSWKNPIKNIRRNHILQLFQMLISVSQTDEIHHNICANN